MRVFVANSAVVAKDAAWLFMDFDGVICDSLEECYQSSRLVADGVEIGSAELPPDMHDDAYRARFRAARPFIRYGEDYVVLHRLLRAGLDPRDQAGFDAELARLGGVELAGIKERLYEVRESLLASHRSQWLGWNPLYPGMAGSLARLADQDRAYILSTKKVAFIAEILAFNGIAWPARRILYSGSERKLAIIERYAAAAPAILIDDQVDHLDFSHSRCSCYLASWGYVSPAAASAGLPGLSLRDCLALLDRFGAS